MESWDGIIDRRRSRRAAPREGIECRVQVRTSVHVLDLSLTGALLATEMSLPAGTSGQLMTTLDQAPVVSRVEVVRNGPHRHQARREMGARFGAMDDECRTCLGAFLQRART